MSDLESIHNRAMDLAEEALIAKMNSDLGAYNRLSKEAFELECRAADLLEDDIDNEPNRSVLYRSAASLAIDCGDKISAKKLIAIALSGNPPKRIENELRDLLDETERAHLTDYHAKYF